MNRSLAGRVPRADPLVLAAVAGLGLLTLMLLIGGNGDLGLTLTPLALTLVLVLAVRAPLRHSRLRTEVRGGIGGL